MKNIILSFICLIICACASKQSINVKPIYLNNGELAIAIKCADQADCMQEAGNICGSDGYNVAYNMDVDKGQFITNNSNGSATKIFGTVISNSSETSIVSNLHDYYIMFQCHTLNTYKQYISMMIKKSGKEYTDINGICYWLKTSAEVSKNNCESQKLEPIKINYPFN